MNTERMLQKAIAAQLRSSDISKLRSAEQGLRLRNGVPKFDAPNYSIRKLKINPDGTSEMITIDLPKGCCNPDLYKPLPKAYINLTCSHSVPYFVPCTKCRRSSKQAKKLLEVYSEAF